MSTNYYLVERDSKNSIEAGLHVGLFSGGLFHLKAYPRLRLLTFQDWVFKIKSGKYRIIDEYEKDVETEHLLALALVAKDSASKGNLSAFYDNAPVMDLDARKPPCERYRDPEGHLFMTYNFS